MWFVADDVAMTLRRERTHFLPAVCFFERVQEPAFADLPLVDRLALAREPDWLPIALEIVSGLQMDTEWLLELTDK